MLIETWQNNNGFLQIACHISFCNACNCICWALKAEKTTWVEQSVVEIYAAGEIPGSISVMVIIVEVVMMITMLMVIMRMIMMMTMMIMMTEFEGHHMPWFLKSRQLFHHFHTF